MLTDPFPLYTRVCPVGRLSGYRATVIAGLRLTSPDKLTLNLYYNVKSFQTRGGRKLFAERRALGGRMKGGDGGDGHTMTGEG